jgi:predicted ATP-grasp superfamily ATP-dependent carboligase
MRLFLYELISAGGLGRDAAVSLRREGWAMLAALAADFTRVPGVDVCTLLHEGAAPPLGHTCARCTPATEAQQFAALAAQCAATLVIAPEFDGLLEQRSRTVLDVGGKLLGSAPDAVRLTADKLALAQHWHARGVPTPLTQVWRAGGVSPLMAGSRDQEAKAPRSPDAPVVVKPRHGAGSMATFLLRSPADLPLLAESECPRAEFIVQSYIDGLAASVALLMNGSTALPLVPAAQHLSGDGRFRYEGGALPLPPPLAARATTLALRAVAGIAGLAGYVGVDLVLGASPDCSDDAAIEINPRPTTSYLGLRRLCADNLAAVWLQLWRGEPPAPLSWHEGEIRFHPDRTEDKEPR